MDDVTEKMDEVDLLTKAGNYGWRVYDGFDLFHTNWTPGGSTPPESINPIFPTLVMRHSETHSNLGLAALVAGYVYRARRDPCLYGRFIYADLYGFDMWTTEEIPYMSGNFSSERVNFTCTASSPIPCSFVNSTTIPAFGYIYSTGSHVKPQIQAETALWLPVDTDAIPISIWNPHDDDPLLEEEDPYYPSPDDVQPPSYPPTATPIEAPSYQPPTPSPVEPPSYQQPTASPVQPPSDQQPTASPIEPPSSSPAIEVELGWSYDRPLIPELVSCLSDTPHMVPYGVVTTHTRIQAKGKPWDLLCLGSAQMLHEKNVTWYPYRAFYENNLLCRLTLEQKDLWTNHHKPKVNWSQHLAEDYQKVRYQHDHLWSPPTADDVGLGAGPWALRYAVWYQRWGMPSVYLQGHYGCQMLQHRAPVVEDSGWDRRLIGMLHDSGENINCREIKSTPRDPDQSRVAIYDDEMLLPHAEDDSGWAFHQWVLNNNA
ncbi:HIPL1 protein [Carex littledalei]|uniref:HIPL1 protein n=1 Tax=Carex littledalei TaxID=544730 RepID=A0A833VDY1_9POAL|nr:HIPL1 protein [Carex littledalei]